jgi:two-component system chemotaxis sensor kinase CheA
VSFFSEERASELKDLFFESATELLQALNEQGLELEQRPGDAEVVRGVRRTVHTLKGDSAACGYTELSSLAHELEDALTPELAKSRGTRVAEVVLSAADTFQDMLNAYRGNSTPPSGASVLAEIRKLVSKAESPELTIVAAPVKASDKFEWSEYEKMVLQDAASRGLKVVQLSLALDPTCKTRAVAWQMVKNTFQDLGNVLLMLPEDGAGMEKVDNLFAALASSFDEEYIAKKCRIPTVIGDVVVERLVSGTSVPAVAEPAKPRAEQMPDATQVIAETTPEPDADLVETGTASFSSAPESTLRVDAEKIDAVLNLVGELIIGKSMLNQTIIEFDKKFGRDPLHAKFADVLGFQARVLADLQKSVMKVRMVPVEQLFRRFGRVVRDVSKQCGREVRLELKGQTTDLDKSILDTLAEPMAHLVRNAIGHGIESPEERVAQGKERFGTITLNAYHQGNNVVIEVSDDGRGIDRNKVINKATERDLISRDEAAKLTDGEALNLIFHPGLSTAEEVTSVSGRGVGMDVVKSVLDRLKGSVSIETEVGQGSTFYLKVPLTLAIIKALMFRVAEKLYALPLTSVVEIVRANESEIHCVDQHEVIRLRNEVLTLVRLNRLTADHQPRPKIFVIVVALGDRKFGLLVDKLVGEEELVIKALDDHLVSTDLVSGASILGDGTVVLILDVQSVISKLGRAKPQAMKAGASA